MTDSTLMAGYRDHIRRLEAAKAILQRDNSTLRADLAAALETIRTEREGRDNARI